MLHVPFKKLLFVISKTFKSFFLLKGVLKMQFTSRMNVLSSLTQPPLFPILSFFFFYSIEHEDISKYFGI